MPDKVPRGAYEGRLRNLNQPEYVALREVIEEILTRTHVSQRSLSARLGEPHEYVNRFLRGRRTIEWSELVAMCAAIPVDVAEVVAEAMKRVGPR